MVESKRGRGRPPLPPPGKRMVSLRLDVGIWDALGRAVERGQVRSREVAVNRALGLLAAMLDERWQRGERNEVEDG